MSSNKHINRFIYIVFCAFTGVVIAAISWSFLKLMGFGIEFLWSFLPDTLNFPFYTLIVCTVGGLIIGLYQRKLGPYPEELETVLKKVKRDKFYPYNNVLFVCLAALLPLIFGGSIGPEAGLTGVIVGLCYWAGKHMKYAKNKIPELMQMGISSTLGVIFGAPLFGLVAPIEEGIDRDKDVVIPRWSKIISNVISIATSLLTFWVLTALFGGGLGMPRIDAADITNRERLWAIPIALIGIALGYLYLCCNKFTKFSFGKIQSKFGIVPSTTLGGLLLGISGTFLPMTMFSGEEAMGEMPTLYSEFAPWLLIATGLIKILLTNVCLSSGWRGGHFFPVIFCGVSVGYAVSLLTGLNAAFCLGVVTAALLGVTMRKPIAVSLLLMLCFNVNVIVWVLIAALIGSIVPLFGLKTEK